MKTERQGVTGKRQRDGMATKNRQTGGQKDRTARQRSRDRKTRSERQEKGPERQRESYREVGS